MAPRHKVRLKDQAGIVVAELTHWRELQYRHEVNAPGYVSLTVNGQDPNRLLVELDGQIEVWRSDLARGLDWYLEAEALCRKPTRVLTEAGDRTYNIVAPGYQDLLARRVIAYYADTGGSYKVNPAETVMKEYVNENAGPGATAAPPAAIVNYARNPSAEVNVTDDWTFSQAGAGGSANQDATRAVAGTQSFRLRAGNAAVRQRSILGVVVPAGATVAVSGWAWCSANPLPAKASIRIYDATAAADRATAVATAASVGAWEYLTAVWFNSTGMPATIQFGQHNDFNDSAADVWFDACQLELATAASRYTDGDVLGGGYSWAGIPHNSISQFTRGTRATDGVLPGLTVQADGGVGGIWTGKQEWGKLLDALRAIGDATGLRFDVVGTGPATFEFRTYVGQRGTDRRTLGLDPATGLNGAGNPPLIFTVEGGRIKAAQYTEDRTAEATVAIVLGGGQGTLRAISVRDDPLAAAESPWNRAETVRNASNETDPDALDLVGDARLAETQAKRELAFTPAQVEGAVYGRDYTWGDLVTARFDGIEADKEIKAVTVTVAAQAGGESIAFELGNPVS